MIEAGRMIRRLKKRREFVAAAKGAKAARRAFILQSLRREDDGPARFGFTVSKRTAKKAVERNRIRRRLREAVRLAEAVPPGRDYVLVGRVGALSQGFSAMSSDLAALLQDASGWPARTGRATRSPSR